MIVCSGVCITFVRPSDQVRFLTINEFCMLFHCLAVDIISYVYYQELISGVYSMTVRDKFLKKNSKIEFRLI